MKHEVAGNSAESAPNGEQASGTTSTVTPAHHRTVGDATLRRMSSGRPVDPPIRVLITGYGAFESVADNPTAEIAELLGRMKFDNAVVEVHVLPVTWRAVDKFIEGELKRFRPDVVIEMGYDEGHHEIKEFATNKREGADASGVEGSGKVSAKGPDNEKSTLPIARIERDQKKLKSGGLQLQNVSDPTDDYLCNYIEYRTLQSLAGTDAEVGFLHISDVNRDTKAAKLAVDTAIADVRERKKAKAQHRAESPSPAKVSMTGGDGVDSGTRAKTENVLGTSLEGVRVHTDLAASQAAASLGARAFTVGQDIYFGAGQYDPTTEDGQQLIAHELAHTVQQRSGALMQAKLLGESSSSDGAEREADAVADKAIGGGGTHSVSSATSGIAQRKALSPKDPREFPTYEAWIAAFATLPTFTSTDTTPAGRANNDGTGYSVIGEMAKGSDQAQPEDRPEPGEKYIDHPSLAWLKANLPDELRASVYTLPADCADTAFCLRHVWLFAHGRTETYGTWVIGVGAGATPAARAARLRELLVNHVYSGSVSVIVSTAYSDASGGRLRSFAKLQPLLHVGDQLVWEHHDPANPTKRIGGHTQTIQTITRDDQGLITSIDCLEGNQPINEPQAVDIATEQKNEHLRPQSEDDLRAMPGRRIERGNMTGSELADNSRGVWTWNDENATTLVAAGPPQAAPRPAAAQRDPKTHALKRSLSDWFAPLNAATSATLQGVFEAALYEVRAAVDGGAAAIAPADLQQLGQLAGARAATLAGDIGDQMIAEVNAMAASPATTHGAKNMAAAFGTIAQGFTAARQNHRVV